MSKTELSPFVQAMLALRKHEIEEASHHINEERNKKNMKDVGYRYVGRGKDRYDNGYAQYELKPKNLSSKECEVIYRIKITRLV